MDTGGSGGYGFPRINQRVNAIIMHYFTTLNPDTPDLDQPVAFRIQPGSLRIETHSRKCLQGRCRRNFPRIVLLD